MLEQLKSKVTNPYLKANFTLPNIANFFANFISGNEHLSNIQVKDLSRLRKVDISGNLMVNKKAYINNLEFKNLQSEVLNITQNEITFDPEMRLRMKNSKIVIFPLKKAFKIKDIFEVIAFMKYILKICGTRLERCDFKNLLNVNKTDEVINIIKFMTSQNVNVHQKNIKNPITNNQAKSNFTKPEIKAPNKINEFKEKKSNYLRVNNDYKFKQKNELDLEKEIKSEINNLDDLKSNSFDSEYINLMGDPSIQQYMNDYYYSTRKIYSKSKPIF